MSTQAMTQTQFVSLNGADAPVLSRLTYSAAEPFAVGISFRTERGNWVHWSFARELLVTGLTEPCGLGDVRVRPDLSEDEEVLALEIESPDGYALVGIEREAVEDFLAGSTELVPLGAESEHFDVEALIAEISNV